MPGDERLLEPDPLLGRHALVEDSRALGIGREQDFVGVSLEAADDLVEIQEPHREFLAGHALS
jgi:hypothetical protein